MKRDEFKPIMNTELEYVKALFNRKNEGYGDADEVFYNFRETARRVFGSTDHADMWKVIMTYMDKHMVALTKGIDEREFVERLRDIIVYSLLGIALRGEHEVAKAWAVAEEECERAMMEDRLYGEVETEVSPCTN